MTSNHIKTIFFSVLFLTFSIFPAENYFPHDFQDTELVARTLLNLTEALARLNRSHLQNNDTILARSSPIIAGVKSNESHSNESDADDSFIDICSILSEPSEPDESEVIDICGVSDNDFDENDFIEICE